ncbi:MAG: insulinase family protein [Polyangiaceae bacterium]|nr:insulinase family protein [Polyangiaceae bacterium]
MPHTRAASAGGLPVITVPRRSHQRVAVALFVRIGSRFEREPENGISHFLEHMLYRGTRTLPTAHAQANAFESLGSSLYAATATDHGVLSLSLPPENLEPALRLLAEVVLTPRFTCIEVERRIVHEEILESLDDDGRNINADDLLRGMMFEGHGLGYPITGTPAHLATFTEADLARHHAAAYVVSNCALAVAGRFDEGRVRGWIDDAFAPLPRGARAVVAPPPPLVAPRARYVSSDGSQTDVRVGFRAPSEQDPREPAAEMLLRVIDDGMSTRLYERICDERGLCYDVSASYETFEDSGVFDFGAETQHARAPEVTRELLALCRDLADHGPTEAELEKARARTAWQTRAMLDDADDLAGFFGLAEVARVTASPEARAEELLSVSREQVRDTAATLFRPDNLTAVAVGVLGAKAERELERAVSTYGR